MKQVVSRVVDGKRISVLEDMTPAQEQAYLDNLAYRDRTVADRKRLMQIDVQRKRDDVYAIGYSHDFGPGLGGVHMLDTRPEDAARWIEYQNACQEAVVAGNGTQVMTLPIRTSANVNLAVRANQGLAAMNGMRDRAGSILQYSWTLKDQIQTATDHAALDAININAGWPA